MTDEPGAGEKRSWGHGILRRNCAHVRRSSEGPPNANDVDGAPVGLAVCGCLLIADIDPNAKGVIHCSVCLEMSAQQDADPSA